MSKLRFILLALISLLFLYSCAVEDVDPELSDDPIEIVPPVDDDPTPTPPQTVAPEITLSSLSVGLMVGEQETLVASFWDSLDTQVDVPFIWVSEDESIATVDDNGLITAIAEGSTNVIVSFEDVTTTASINVAPDENAPSSIVVSVERNEILEVGETKSLSVNVFNLAGEEIELENLVWTVNDGSVASIDANNILTATGEGTTQFFASANGLISGSVSITVIEPAPEPEPTFLERRAELQGLPGYSGSGDIILRQELATGELELIFEDNVSFSRGPGLYPFLSSIPSLNASTIRTQPNFMIDTQLRGRGGSAVFNLTAEGFTGNINSLDYVVIHCFPFGVSFASGLFGSVEEVFIE